MSTEITIKFDFLSLVDKLNAVAQEQIPFATSLALNNVAKLAQADLRENLSKTFTIRTPWVSRGIQFRASNKRDWPHSSAEIGSRDEFMALQATGGVKKPRGNTIAQPFAARENKADLTPMRKWPSRLKNKKGVFIGPNRKTGLQALYQRMTSKRYPLRMLYLFKHEVKVKQRWEIEERVNQVLARFYDKEFGRALAYAMRTSMKSRPR